MLAADKVGTPSGQLSGDPLAFARRSGNGPVQAARQLQGDHRPGCLLGQQETLIDLLPLGFAKPDVDSDAGRTQLGEASAVHAGIGVEVRYHHAGNAGGDHRVRAGRRAAVMGARLESHVGRGPTRRRSSALQRLGFGMGAPAGLGPAAAHHAPIGDNDAAHGRIGRRPTERPPGERQRRLHEGAIGCIL